MVEAVAAPAAGRVALVAGATGLVGREVLAILLADKSYRKVHTLGRRAPALAHAKLHHHAVDFAQLPALPPIDDVFVALGTTIKTAGSRQAFRSVDLDAVMALAQAAHAAGAHRLGVVSAMGADADSRVFYSRVKGEMEQQLSGAGFDTLVVARPSMLDGDRAALGQDERPGERVGLAIMRACKPLIPSNYRAILARDVARALVDAVRDGRPGKRILLSGDLQPVAPRS